MKKTTIFSLLIPIFLLISCDDNNSSIPRDPRPNGAINSGQDITADDVEITIGNYLFTSDSCQDGLSALDISSLLTGSFIRYQGGDLFTLELNPQADKTSIDFFYAEGSVDFISSFEGAELSFNDHLLLTLYLDSIEKISLTEGNLALKSGFAGFCDLSYAPTEIDPDDFDYEQPSNGSLIISEFMANPSGQDNENEWIEITNTSASTISLTDVTLVINGNISINFPSQFMIGAGEIILVGGQNVADCDLTFSNMALGNNGGTIELINQGEVIDIVNYNGWTVPNGKSLSLKNDKYDDIDNDFEINWKESTPTPGAMND